MTVKKDLNTFCLFVLKFIMSLFLEPLQSESMEILNLVSCNIPIQYTIYNIQPQTYNIQPQTYIIYHQIYNIQPQTYYIQPQTYIIYHQICNIQPQTYNYISSNIQYTISNILYTI